MNIKTFILLCCILLVMPVTFFACSSKNENKNRPGSISHESDQEVILAKQGEICFRIVRPENCSLKIKDSLSELSLLFIDNFDAKAEMATDWKRNNESYDPDTFEILVGATGHDEIPMALSRIGFGDYVIFFNGKKLILTGWTDEGTVAAVQHFSEYLKLHKKDGVLSIPVDLFESGTIREEYNLVATPDGRELLGYTRLADDSKMFTVGMVTNDGFDKYIRKLKDNNYREITRYKIADNEFAALTDGTDNIILSRYALDNTLTITVGKAEDTPIPAEVSGTYDKVCYSQITLLGIEVMPNDNNGLGIIIRLDNGKFIIIDGGYQRNEDAALIMRTLKEQAKDPDNIEIAAWIFTHLHVDHVGAFINFTPLYHSKVNVESFIYAPSPDNYPEESTGYHRIMAQLFKKYEGATVYHARTGQRYMIGNAEIEFLFTTENLYPDCCYQQANTNSLIFIIKVEGKKLLITGDATDLSMDFVNRNYGSYIKCDIIQAAHHGAAHGDNLDCPDTLSIEQFYKNASPNSVLWPTSKKHYEENILTKIRPAVGILLSGNTEQILSSDKNSIIVLKNERLG